MASISFEVAETVPRIPVRVDIDGLQSTVDAIAALEGGAGLRLTFAGCDPASTLQNLRVACVRRGFFPAFRSFGDEFFAFKTNKPVPERKFVPREMSARNVEILAGLNAGKTYQSLANEYGVTRQRIEQIALKNGIRRNKMLRHAATLEFLAPYLEKAFSSHCLICKSEREGSSRAHRLCDNCHKNITALVHVKSRLRSWQKNGNRQNLATALQFIRQRNIKPEDLELV